MGCPGHDRYVHWKVKFVDVCEEALRKELVDTPIRVTSICPGLVETEFSIVRFKGDTDQAKKPYVGMEPLTGIDIAGYIYLQL
jgi:3-hydroxy acid dehydrogenase/malonic semialdehyde reductase